MGDGSVATPERLADVGLIFPVAKTGKPRKYHIPDQPPVSAAACGPIIWPSHEPAGAPLRSVPALGHVLGDGRLSDLDPELQQFG